MEFAGDNSLSSGSTIPNTLGPGASPDPRAVASSHNGDFARLIPENRPARIAFSAVAEKIKRNASWNAHVMRYMYISLTKGDAAGEMSASETEAELTPQPCLWTGYYRFNMEILPSIYRLGWVVGRGRPDLANGGIDFQLTCNKSDHVAGRHARFSHTSAGILLIRSDSRRVILDGKEEFRNDQRAITSPVTGVGFGDLTYTLVFTNMPEYRDQLARFRRENGEVYESPAFLNPTPSGNDYVLQKYSIQGVFAQGSSCTVSAGYNRLTGSLVAIKKIKRTVRNTANIDREVKLSNTISPHPYICELVEVLRVGSQASLEIVDETYLIYSPLAEMRLEDLIFSGMDIRGRIIIFRQVTEAVAHIHGMGVMHRDIKPTNIAIVSCNPPKSSLIDFGSATDDTESLDHMAGTIRYLAPEVMALKTRALKDSVGLKPYDKAVDIWGLGASAYELLLKNRTPWKSHISRESFIQAKVELCSAEQSVPNDIIDLVEHMLRWSSADRISAAEAMRVLREAYAEETQRQVAERAGAKHISEE